MKRLATTLAMLVAIVFTQVQPSVNFSATWQRPGVARLTWVQPEGNTRACLTRIPANAQQVALDCYDNIPAGSQVVILLGATGPMDGNMRPQAGDSFGLRIGDERYTALLRTIVRLPVFYL